MTHRRHAFPSTRPGRVVRAECENRGVRMRARMRGRVAAEQFLRSRYVTRVIRRSLEGHVTLRVTSEF